MQCLKELVIEAMIDAMHNGTEREHKLILSLSCGGPRRFGIGCPHIRANQYDPKPFPSTSDPRDHSS
jgi:hypothetical protein